MGVAAQDAQLVPFSDLVEVLRHVVVSHRVPRELRPVRLVRIKTVARIHPPNVEVADAVEVLRDE